LTKKIGTVSKGSDTDEHLSFSKKDFEPYILIGDESDNNSEVIHMNQHDDLATSAVSEKRQEAAEFTSALLSLSGVLVPDSFGDWEALVFSMFFIERLAMGDIVFFQDGSKVSRPGGNDSPSVLKAGRKVFLYPRNQQEAVGNTFILVGVILSNTKNSLSSHAVLLHEKLITPSDLTALPFKVCPVKFVGKMPNGKEIESTRKILSHYENQLAKFFEAL
jgi:hypothetical protein